MEYIKVGNIQNKLKSAARSGRPLYIYGSVGMGKTTAVDYYLRRRKSRKFKGSSGFYKNIPEIDSISEDIIVFDDISNINDYETEEFIIDCLNKLEGKWFILIGRGQVPNWLERESVECGFMLADNNNLMMSDDEVVELFASAGINIEAGGDDFMNILHYSDRNTLMMIYLSQYMTGDTFVTDNTIKQAEKGMFQYMTHVFFDVLDRDIQNAVLSLCQFEEFNTGLAEIILANKKVPALLDRMYQAGDFLEMKSNDVYTFKNLYRRFFMWKRDIEFTKRQINENYERAAVYYEMNEDLKHALECYTMTKNYDKVTSILYSIATKHPGMEGYTDLGKYFDMIPQRTINESPVLMSAMAMLRSLLMDPEGSEMWVHRLERFAEHARSGTAEQKEARQKLLLLKVILPHRSSKGLVDDMANAVYEAKGWISEFQQVSVTDNAPSILNGAMDMGQLIMEYGTDFSSFEKVGREKDMMLGKSAVGFIDLAKLEWEFERCEIESYALNTELNRIYMMTDSAGVLDSCYVSIAIMVRDYLAHGKYNSAEMFFQSFMKKV
jgi:LuxR family maltose regulon positive regulatory protein